MNTYLQLLLLFSKLERRYSFTMPYATDLITATARIHFQAHKAVNAYLGVNLDSNK